MQLPQMIPPNMDLFHSARLKLTAFYFAVLVVLCLLLTFGVHAFTNHELNRSDDARLGAVHQLFQRYTDLTNNGYGPGTQYFVNAQQHQADVTRRHLNEDYLLVDLVLLAVGAAVSYWYAGWTLRPIEEAHKQQKRFTSDASHELRTPLASMQLENEVFLRQKHFSEEEARGLISSNLEEVGRLQRLATNLLSLNKYEHGTISHTPVVIGDVVADAIARAKRSREAKKIRFTPDIVAAKVDIDRESITELLTILLDNAVKYGPKDGAVEIIGHMRDEAYALTVRDHGPGIADADLPHIFERMYRGDKARSSKVAGHGIGLSLAQQIAEANEATLTAKNAPGGGAEFTVTF